MVNNNTKIEISPINFIKNENNKIIIPIEVENKIRALCKKVYNIEWSGILFYKKEGTFEDNNLRIICVDIFPMDIGTTVYTEFQESPDIISYMTGNTELLDCQMGLVHSHHSMSTFFSGTDKATLKEEGTYKNHFVSLIVNNDGQYTAAITRKIKSNKTIIEDNYYNSFNGEVLSYTKEYKEETEELEYFQLVVEVEEIAGIEERLKEIKESKAKKVIPKKNPIKNNSNIQYKGDQYEEDLFERNPRDYYTEEGFIEDDNIPIENISDADYESFEIDKEAIKQIVLKLVTGSIILPHTSKLDIKKWVNGMSSLYENTFGKGEEGFDLFKKWAEGYIEFLCWYNDDVNVVTGVYDEMMSASIYAYNIIKELESLPQNKYIKGYIDILDTYLNI